MHDFWGFYDLSKWDHNFEEKTTIFGNSFFMLHLMQYMIYVISSVRKLDNRLQNYLAFISYNSRWKQITTISTSHLRIIAFFGDDHVSFIVKKHSWFNESYIALNATLISTFYRPRKNLKLLSDCWSCSCRG